MTKMNAGKFRYTAAASASRNSAFSACTSSARNCADNNVIMDTAFAVSLFVLSVLVALCLGIIGIMISVIIISVIIIRLIKTIEYKGRLKPIFKY